MVVNASIYLHIQELRRRLLVSAVLAAIGTCLCFLFYPWIFNLLTLPLSQLNLASTHPLYLTSILEGFLTKFKVSFQVGLLATSPFHLINILGFVFPGLSKKEKIWTLVACMISFLLIIISAYLTYFHILPHSLAFLTSQAVIPDNVGFVFGYQQNVTYILKFLVVALVVFQTPILLEVLLAMNIITRKFMLKNMRYFIVGVFVMSAIFTPPDIVSQIGVSLPLIILYFLTIAFAKLFKFGETP